MDRYECEVCGEEFEQRSRYERHMLTSHPKQAVSGADLTKTLAGADFPKTKEELERYAREQGKTDVAQVISRLPEREYASNADVVRGFGEMKDRPRAS